MVTYPAGPVNGGKLPPGHLGPIGEDAVGRAAPTHVAFRFTMKSIQIGANGDTHPFETG
jgi:hypothetical protein